MGLETTQTSFWTSPWLRPFNDVAAIDDLLAQVHPTWALGRIKARVAAVVDETPDTKSFVLRPNRNWPGFRAGQHVGVEVDVAGVRHHRRYSLSSAERADRVTITVKRQAGGIVSNWLHDRLRPGDALVLQAPAGDFVLPNPLPERVLLLAAGSGVTPHMAMIRTLAARDARTDLVLLHVVRRPADAIFAAELDRLAERWQALTVRRHQSESAGRFDVTALGRMVPDHAERHTLLCGPTRFMETFRDHWRRTGAAARLQLESFGAPLVAAGSESPQRLEIRCSRSERLFTAAGTAPLLVEAEHAGLRPRSGCRMGICHSCSCVKRSGVVENLLTGELSTEPDERIQLCISRARTDLTLDL